jgi:hypothetical protein
VEQLVGNYSRDTVEREGEIRFSGGNEESRGTRKRSKGHRILGLYNYYCVCLQSHPLL